MSTPASTTHPSPTHGKTRPEAVRLAVLVWATTLALELVHQILQVVMAYLDPADLMAQSQEVANGASELQVRFSVYASIGLVGLFNVAITAGLFFALHFYARGHRMSDGARRLLLVFSIFFAFRGLLIFGAVPAGTNVPEWLWLLDGALQLVVAVAGVVAVVLSSREEALAYVDKREPSDGADGPDTPDETTRK